MARFNTDTFRSLNESIARIQNPIAALDEAMEYTSILEAVILDLCEALDLDPQALVEDALTASASEVLAKRKRKTDAASDRAMNHPGNLVYAADPNRSHVYPAKRKAGEAALRRTDKASAKVYREIDKKADSKTVYTASKGGKLKKAGKGANPVVRSATEFRDRHGY